MTADKDTGQTSVDWLFAGGDAVTGPSSVVEAVAPASGPPSASTST